MAKSAADFVTIDLPCPKCGRIDRQRMRKLEGKSETTCGFCSEVIDLSSPKFKARLRKEIEGFEEISIER